jgi:hypothetical protein
MNVTSIQNAPAAARNRRAMTLMDVLIAVTITTILFAAIGTLAVSTARSFVALGNYGDLDRASRDALDVLSRDVRQSRAVTAYTPKQISLLANDNSTLTYTYDPSTGNFTRQSGAQTKVLLSQCDYLNFNIYQRNPSNNWSWYPVASNLLSTAKLIDVSWKCSRKILGQKINTESVQTAKVVIRN